MTIPLGITDLTIHFGHYENVVHGLDLEVREREILALVGESGSGKTLTARSVLGLLPSVATMSGAVLLRGFDVLQADAAQLRKARGADAAMIFQEPSTALNPVFRVGWQMSEGLRVHGVGDAAERRARCVELLAAVGIPDPETRIDHYPHQFSGGQKQRIVIAMALALRPALIIADEPTTALDVTVQAEILDLLRKCRDEFGASILLITHNMGVVADLADRVAVMYRGSLVEQAPVEELFAAPREEYTKALLAAVPKLGVSVVRERPPASGEPVLSVEDLDIVYRGRTRRHDFHAVRSVSFSVRPGEVYGLVGESGSGKTTIGKSVIGLAPVSSGRISVCGEDLGAARGARLRALRRRVGFVFQDPASSFNPFLTVAECITEPMSIHRVGDRRSRLERARELLDAVQLPAGYAERHPHELSGGQRQRVGLARALVLNPELLIADEPTSALDVSVQAKVLDLFLELQRELRFGSLFISHDLAVVEMLADRVGVLSRGELVESGPTASVLRSPEHPYTQKLIAAVPTPDPAVQRARRTAFEREETAR
ncbi:dipeptide ABC transporter ATP-binding protein [Lentzea sp. JNUCC 0626]|uniref:dipeptide ABC transporter ATP-binding protein n=1 Tax=Lentzea sp. JNUCC 0626 TaxID=3367513 RepID=UPI003748D1CB